MNILEKNQNLAAANKTVAAIFNEVVLMNILISGNKATIEKFIGEVHSSQSVRVLGIAYPENYKFADNTFNIKVKITVFGNYFPFKVFNKQIFTYAEIEASSDSYVYCKPCGKCCGVISFKDGRYTSPVALSEVKPRELLSVNGSSECINELDEYSTLELYEERLGVRNAD